MNKPGLKKLVAAPINQGWYWCCEGYSPFAMSVYFVGIGGHNEHELTFKQAGDIDGDWWGPIQSPEDPEYYGDEQ